MTHHAAPNRDIGTEEASLSAADRIHLSRALELAWEGRNVGRHPFGSLVVSAEDTVLAEAWNNSMPPEGDPTQHAELRAVAAASRAVPFGALAEATLYTSAEPCVMCTGAVYWAGIGRIVYALSEHRLLELTGDNPENPTFALPCREVLSRGQRTVTVVGPVLQDEAAAPHEGFWN